MYLNRKKEDYVMMYFKIKRFIKELGVISLYLLRGEYSLDLLLSNLFVQLPLSRRGFIQGSLRCLMALRFISMIQ